MNATFSEAIQLTIGAIVGLGLSITMENNGVSLFKRETSSKALGYLSIFCMVWIIFSTAFTELLAENISQISWFPTFQLRQQNQALATIFDRV